LVKLTAVTEILVKLTAVTEILVKLTAVTEILVKLTAVIEILVKLTAVTEILVKLTCTRCNILRFFGDLESFPLNNLYVNVVCNKEMKYVQWATSAIFL
jgi:hypothetical protein